MKRGYLSRPRTTLLQDDFVFFSKSRPTAGEVSENGIKIIGEVSGKTVLLVDDLIDTAKTIVADANAAKKAGAKEVLCFATHALFSQEAVRRMNRSQLDEVIISDTISHESKDLQTAALKITVVTIAPLIAKAIRRIHDGESLSSLII